MVVTMKMVANTARQAMAMRDWVTKARVEQGWTSVRGGLFEVSRGTGGVDFVVGIGNLLGTWWMKTPAVLLDTASVVLLAESVVNEIVEDSAVELVEVKTVEASVVELSPTAPDVEILVIEAGWGVDESSALVVDVSLFELEEYVVSDTVAASEVGFAVILDVDAEGLLRFWMKVEVDTESAGEVVEDKLDATSGSLAEVGCGEDTESVAGGAADGVTSIKVVGVCWRNRSFVGFTVSGIVVSEERCASPAAVDAAAEVWSCCEAELLTVVAAKVVVMPFGLSFLWVTNTSSLSAVGVAVVSAAAEPASAGLSVLCQAVVSVWTTSSPISRSAVEAEGMLLVAGVETLMDSVENKADIPHSSARYIFMLSSNIVTSKKTWNDRKESN